MIGYCSLHCVPAANHRKLRGRTYGRLVLSPPFSVLAPHQKKPGLSRSLRVSLFRAEAAFPAHKRRPPLPWVQSVHNNGWHGASRLITSAHTHLCGDGPFCHPVQSSKLSLGSLRSYGISLAFFSVLPPPLPSFALKLPLLELLSCSNRYNLRRLPVLGWDGTYLSRVLLCARRIKSYPTMHPVTRDAGLAR